MAMFLRRAIPSRNAILLLRSSRITIQTHNISQALFSHNLLCSPETHNAPDFPSFDFLKDSRRGFAKGKVSKDDSAVSTVEVVADIRPVKASANSQMEAAIVALSRELAKLRTGRASAGMLDHLIVEIDGVKLPLNRLAAVSVMDPKTLSVNPFDPNTLKKLENAIVESPLGLNPRIEGERLIASIPVLSKEHMQALCKVVAKSCEDVKQSIRRSRQKALDTIKKASSMKKDQIKKEKGKKTSSGFPEDDIKRLEKELDDLTKKFMKSAEDMCKAKEKEILEG